MPVKRTANWLLAVALGLSACVATPQSVPAPTEAMIEPPTSAAPVESAMPAPTEAMPAMATEAVREQPTEAVSLAELPIWFSVPLQNVRSGETFTLADLQGQVVLVETMAIWCSNCLRQQQQVKALHDLLGERGDFVSLGLAIDANETAEQLVAYTSRHEFDWTYAVSPVELSRELSLNYGAQFLNPPSTPMLIVDRRGGVHPLPFGLKSAADLKSALEPFLADGG